MKKLTIEQIKERLIGRNIEIIGEYFGAHKPTRFKCISNKCNYEWPATTSDVINKNTGCPQCVGLAKLTNATIDKKLKEDNRTLIRTGNYINNITPIQFLCTISDCQYDWATFVTNILYGAKTGCPQCVGVAPLTNKIVDRRLIGRNIIRISDYINLTTPIWWKCTVISCNYQWEVSPNNIIGTNRSGCPQCAGLVELTNNIIDVRLIGRHIMRYSSYIDAQSPMEWKCMKRECLHKWKTSANHILNDETGCPKCSRSKNEKIIGRVLDGLNIEYTIHCSIKSLSKLEQKRIIVDYYLPKYNTIIEYNGHQHYQPTKWFSNNELEAEEQFLKQQQRDAYLQAFCQNNNIQLIWIDGRKLVNSKLQNYIINNVVPILAA